MFTFAGLLPSRRMAALFSPLRHYSADGEKLFLRLSFNRFEEGISSRSDGRARGGARSDRRKNASHAAWGINLPGK